MKKRVIDENRRSVIVGRHIEKALTWAREKEEKEQKFREASGMRVKVPKSDKSPS